MISYSAHHSQFNDILKIFNSFHARLNFTLETSDNNSINFLDTKIIIDDHRIIFDLYKKPMFSERYLNFHSHHLVAHKRDIIFGMVDKMILLSHPRFHHKNLIEAECLKKNVLLNNGYPLSFIFNTIRSRIILHSKKELLTLFKNKDDNNLKLI